MDALHAGWDADVEDSIERKISDPPPDAKEKRVGGVAAWLATPVGWMSFGKDDAVAERKDDGVSSPPAWRNHAATEEGSLRELGPQFPHGWIVLYRVQRPDELLFSLIVLFAEPFTGGVLLIAE